MIVINLLRVKWGVLFPSCKFDYYLYSFYKFTNFTGVFLFASRKFEFIFYRYRMYSNYLHMSEFSCFC